MDVSTTASSFEYVDTTVAIPHVNAPHEFSLSWGLRADKWVLDCQKKKPPCAPSPPISSGAPFYIEKRATSIANFLVSILGRSNVRHSRNVQQIGEFTC